MWTISFRFVLCEKDRSTCPFCNGRRCHSGVSSRSDVCVGFEKIGWHAAEEDQSSLLELYVAFALDTKSMMPVYMRALKKKTKNRDSAYVLREDSVQADESRSDLNTQLRSFVQLFKWLNASKHWAKVSVDRGTSSPWLSYVVGQFIFPHDSATCRSLWDCFHQGRRSYNLKASWRPFNGTIRGVAST